MKRHWWNSSKGLLAEIHKKPSTKKEEAVWKAFADEYDQSEIQQTRRDAWEQCFTVKTRTICSQLLQLSKIVRADLWHTEEERTASAIKLAELVLYILSEKKRVEELLHCMSPVPRKELNVADVTLALCRFLQREKRLPRKNELNIEANRLLHKIIVPYTVKLEKRQKDYELKNSVSGLNDVWNAPKFGQRLRFREDEFVVYETRLALELCPASQWSEPRWNDFTEILKNAGLSGLQSAS